MESGRESCTGRREKRKNIQWTWTREDELLECAVEAEPGKRGYWRQLEDLWNSQHPTLPSSGRILAARRNKTLEKRDEDMTECHTPMTGVMQPQTAGNPGAWAAQAQEQCQSDSRTERKEHWSRDGDDCLPQPRAQYQGRDTARQWDKTKTSRAGWKAR